MWEKSYPNLLALFASLIFSGKRRPRVSGNITAVNDPIKPDMPKIMKGNDVEKWLFK